MWRLWLVFVHFMCLGLINPADEEAELELAPSVWSPACSKDKAGKEGRSLENELGGKALLLSLLAQTSALLGNCGVTARARALTDVPMSLVE